MSKLNTIWGFAGQIKSLRGPYVVHAYTRAFIRDIEELNVASMMVSF
jgi:hypothetical protein